MHPTLGWTNPGGEVDAIGGATAHVNARGLRADREYSIERPAGVTRIEVFGDSFAFGTEVDDESTYCWVLERILSQAEVLNFGVPGYGLDQMMLRFQTEGVAFHPDIVVIGIVSPLLARTGSFTFWYKPYFEIEAGKLVLHGVPVPSLAEAVSRQRYGLRILDVASMVFDPGSQINPVPLNRAILQHFLAAIRAAGAQPMIVRAPFLDEYLRDRGSSEDFLGGCEPGVMCVDTFPAFAEAHARGVALTTGAHFSPAGHRIVAEAIAKEIRGRRPAAQAGADKGPMTTTPPPAM